VHAVQFYSFLPHTRLYKQVRTLVEAADIIILWYGTIISIKIMHYFVVLAIIYCISADICSACVQ